MNADKARLLSILKEKSVSYGNVTLSSRKSSKYYIDAKETTYDAEGVYLTGKLIYDLIRKKNEGITAVGGLTMGADPIVVSTIIAAMNANYQLNGFSVRKDRKSHGQRKLIEGNLTKGEKVVIVDDVITTGRSTIRAIKEVEEYGCEIVLVVVLVDRCEGGAKKIKQKGHEITSLFKISDVVKSEALKGVKLYEITEGRDQSVDAEGILQEEYT
ncbi:MAG: orotate phosphoribosyltransferase [Candidatus Marinimicrobia bacterium]|nr:orotate phosphoribosyltransferase [Candidatus Neomarinimicrobiota bacterium]